MANVNLGGVAGICFKLDVSEAASRFVILQKPPISSACLLFTNHRLESVRGRSTSRTVLTLGWRFIIWSGVEIAFKSLCTCIERTVLFVQR